MRSLGLCSLLLASPVIHACQPKQPLQPSFFTTQRLTAGPATCRATIDCYARCLPLVEECLLRCDQDGSSFAVERARTVSNCGARHGCNADRACEQAHCAAELQACG